MTEVKFKNRKLNIKKLLSFGFENVANDYTYHKDLVEGQLNLTVKIDSKERIYTKVVDNNSGDEYVLHLVAGVTGSFVGQVKSEYEAVLEEISAKCFDPDVFKSIQAKEIIDYVRVKYQDELEFLWQKFPNNAVWRRKDNQKWYGAILSVSRNKLGIRSNEMVEIIDLRINPKQMKAVIDNEKYFPGWHMNKNNWYTIILDGSVTTAEICQRIDESYNLAIK